MRLLTTVDAVNTKDRTGCTPLCILGKAASESMSLFASCIRFFSTPTSHESPNIDNYKKSLQVLLDHDPSQASKSQFLRDLLHFPKNLLVVSFEKEHTRRVLNDICGRGPYVALLMADFYIQLMIIISFTIGCNFGFKGNGSTTSMLIGSAYWIFRRFASAMGKLWCRVQRADLTSCQVICSLFACFLLRRVVEHYRKSDVRIMALAEPASSIRSNVSFNLFEEQRD